MPGAALAVGLVACAATIAVGLATAGAAAVFGQRLAGASDAAALAAADAASGAIAGVPCELAETVAEGSGMTLASCDVELLVATVTVSGRFAGLAATASARAGPPP